MFAMNTNNKRSREDGQISKEAYQLQSENNNNEIMKNSSFPRASEESIASRKIVTASGMLECYS